MHRTRHDGGPRRPAFTLVELLVVISIIGVLLGTLLPTLAKVRVEILRKTSQATINQVNGAVQAYYDENEVYPDSATVLVDCVAVPWQKGKDPSSRQRTYGPYNGADALYPRKTMRGSQTDSDKGTGPNLFHDSFGNPILYYRYQPEAKSYNQNSIPTDIYRGAPSNVSTYLRGPGGAYYRQDFALMTCGVDAKWEPLYSGDWTTSDDQGNYAPSN